jgi:hypothetical protein
MSEFLEAGADIVLGDEEEISNAMARTVHEHHRKSLAEQT